MDMFRNHGIIPALKYIVMTMNLYQTDRPHISCRVTRYPTMAEAPTIRPVPRTVRAKVIQMDWNRSLTCRIRM